MTDLDRALSEALCAAECAADADRLAELRKILGTLSRFCAVRADAIRMRLAGKIDIACAMEKTADDIHAKLPDSLRW